MDLFYTVLMTLNISCAFLILMSGLRQQKTHLLALAFLNILIFFYHYYSWQFHTATSLSEAIHLSRIHIGLTIIIFPLVIFTFGHWCKYKYTNHLTYLLIIIALILSILNYFVDYSLRYGEVVELIHYKSILGDNLVTIKGTPKGAFIFLKLIYAFTSGLIILFATRLYTQRHKKMAISLILFCLLQIIASYANYKLDGLEWPIFYIGGLPITILSLFCTTIISFLYKTKSEQLVVQRQQQKKLEDAITKLAHGLSTIDNHQFYLELAQMIYELNNADIVLIGAAKEKEKLLIDTLAALENGSPVENFSYPLKNKPCKTVFIKGQVTSLHNVASPFPENKLSNDENFETYLGVPIFNQDGETIGVISLFYKTAAQINSSLINTLKIFASRAAAEIKRDELEQRLKSMAYYDYQSKLPNREKLLETLNEKYFECKKNNSNALFMLIDLDHFDNINRQFGHDVGDQVIRQLGARLHHYSSSNIFIARNSGDEFAFIISDASGEITSLLNVHWQAIKAIINEPCIIGERKITLHCSMGGVLFPQQTDSRFDIISSAEHSIQRAKENGRNNYYLFDPQLLAKIDQDKEMESDLAEAINTDGQLSIAYQAKVTKTGQVIGSEALLRWNHPKKGFISPAVFIPIAEESGLIHNLGKWIINEVCRQIKEWIDLGLPTHKVAINVAASQFNDPDFIHFIFTALENKQLKGKHLEIELTESSLLTNINAAINNLSQLRDYGITIALDDFGTGFSSLSYLQDLPLDVLKIDKSFIDNIAQIKSAELIRSIISICNHMNFKTVAEGTESIEQVRILIEMGCDCFQGYYFSRPLPAHEFMTYCIDNEKNKEL